MLARFDRRNVVTIFPKCSPSVFPAVKFPRSLPRNQLKALGDHLPLTVNDGQMDVIRRYGVVENIQPVALLRLKQPLKPTLSIPYEFEKKLFLVATMRNVPDLSRNMMTVRSRHFALP